MCIILIISASVITCVNQNLISRQSEFRRDKEETLNSKEQNSDSEFDGPLRRHEISQEDHPLSLGKASLWHQYFQVYLFNITMGSLEHLELNLRLMFIKM